MSVSLNQSVTLKTPGQKQRVAVAVGVVVLIPVVVVHRPPPQKIHVLVCLKSNASDACDEDGRKTVRWLEK